MVDCRNCKHCYKIWEEFSGEEPYQIVCLTKKLFVDWEFATSGQCDEYVDMDGHDPRE